MQLLAVELHDFRNLAYGLVEPDPSFTVLAGDNGQGKTNLLEAIYLLGTLISFRAARLEELVRWGCPSARVRGRVARRGVERLYEVEITARPPRKVARVDDKPVRAAADYFGGMNVVLFSPDELGLPRGAPGERRRFVDRAVWNTAPSFLAEAQTYQRILRSRNAVLRDGERAEAEALVEVYDQQLARAGALLVARRRAYLARLGPRFSRAFARITESGLGAELGYESSLTGDDAELAGELQEALARSRRRDFARGFTSVGPHVDDLGFTLGGRPARLHASQGQIRALVLALKIAEIEELEQALGEPPILLLDDVSSELDARRNALLFAFLAEIRCQTFITTTHRGHVLLDAGRRDLTVSRGRLAADSL